MKKMFFTVLLLAISSSAFSQSKSVETLFQKYKHDQTLFHLDVGGSFMNFAKGMNIKLDAANTEAIANSMERLKLFKLPVNGAIAKSDISTLKRGLEKERFELMMEASEKNNEITIYTKGARRIQDIVVLVRDNSGEFIVLELLGDFDSHTLADAGKNLNY